MSHDDPIEQLGKMISTGAARIVEFLDDLPKLIDQALPKAEPEPEPPQRKFRFAGSVADDDLAAANHAPGPVPVGEFLTPRTVVEQETRQRKNRQREADERAPMDEQHVRQWARRLLEGGATFGEEVSNLVLLREVCAELESSRRRDALVSIELHKLAAENTKLRERGMAIGDVTAAIESVIQRRTQRRRSFTDGD